MNDDKPKSIWKKSWRGWHGLLLWMVSLSTAVLLLVVILELLLPGPKQLSRLIRSAIEISALIGVIGVLAVAFVRWLCHWRNFKRFLFGFACFITLIALFYAEEDWRGKHDWDQFKRRWDAKGEHFSFASVVPPQVPEDQNFAFSPVWIAEIRYFAGPKTAEAWYGDRIYGEEVTNLLLLLPFTASGVVGTNWAYHTPETPKVGNWATARLTDLKPWQAYYRNLETTNPKAEISIAPQPQSPAADVLLALSKFDLVIEKLQHASQLPYSRFPIRYDADPPSDILIPHLAALKQLAQVLQLRAIAELQNGQSDQALEDVKLMLCLVNSVHTEPFLISHLVRIAILQLALQPIYEGLAQHRWSAAQLTDLDSKLAKPDFLADYLLAMRGERALHLGVIEFLRHRNRHNFSETFGLFSDNGTARLNPTAVLYYLSSAGWFYQNELHIARFFQSWYLPLVNETERTASPAAVRKAGTAVGSELAHQTPENFLEKWLLPAFGKMVERFAYAQESVDLARVAIALERYRLEHGEYPESLDALAPRFIKKLPHDIINGQPSQGSGSASQPLHYHRTSDDQFVLYSVGWNKTDDGGVVGLTKDGSVDINKGDWVWRYPAK